MMDTTIVTVNRSERDVRDWLPDKARERLNNLRDCREQAGILLREASRHLEEARGELRTKKDQLAEFERAYGAGHVVIEVPLPGPGGGPRARRREPDEGRMAAERAKVEKAYEESQRRQRVYDALVARFEPLGGLLHNVEEWLSQIPGEGAIELYDGAPPKLRKGETELDAVERRRAEITALRAEVGKVKSAPISSTEAKALAHQQIETIAEQGAPDVFGLIEKGRPVKWPTAWLELHVLAAQNRGFAEGEVPNALALMAWMFREEMIAALDAEIDKRADDPNALVAEDRAVKLHELAAAILAAEREECALIEQAATRGFETLPRPDCDPRAYLNICLVRWVQRVIQRR